MKVALCLCAVLRPRATRSRVAVVVHDVELQKSTNTGRLLPLLLEGARLVPYGGPHRSLDVSALSLGQAFVLFPQKGVPTVAEVARGLGDGERTLIVLDGTWHQANRLRKRFLVAGVPFVRLPDEDRAESAAAGVVGVEARPSTYQLRTGSFGASLSTLEAAARALAVFEGDASVEAHLLDGFRRMVDRTLWLRGSKARDDVYGGLPDGLHRHAVDRVADDADLD